MNDASVVDDNAIITTRGRANCHHDDDRNNDGVLV